MAYKALNFFSFRIAICPPVSPGADLRRRYVFIITDSNWFLSAHYTRNLGSKIFTILIFKASGDTVAMEVYYGLFQEGEIEDRSWETQSYEDLVWTWSLWRSSQTPEWSVFQTWDVGVTTLRMTKWTRISTSTALRTELGPILARKKAWAIYLWRQACTNSG